MQTIRFYFILWINYPILLYLAVEANFYNNFIDLSFIYMQLFCNKRKLFFFCHRKNELFLKYLLKKKQSFFENFLKVWWWCAVPCQFLKSSMRTIRSYFTLWINYRIPFCSMAEVRFWKRNNQIHTNKCDKWMHLLLLVLILVSSLTKTGFG